MIRYDEQLNKEIRRVVKNYNAKLARLQKASIDVNLNKASTRKIKRDFDDRRELQVYLRELQKFSKRGAEEIAFTDRYGNIYTYYDVKTARTRQTRAIKQARRKLEQARSLKRTELGEEAVQSLMGTDYAANIEASLQILESARASKSLDQAQQARLIRAATRILGTEKYQQSIRSNLYEIIRKEAQLAGYPESKVDKILAKLGRLSDQNFELARNGEEVIVAIEERYPQMKEASSDAEFASLRQDLTLYLDALYDGVDNIVEYYENI